MVFVITNERKLGRSKTSEWGVWPCSFVVFAT